MQCIFKWQNYSLTSQTPLSTTERPTLSCLTEIALGSCSTISWSSRTLWSYSLGTSS